MFLGPINLTNLHCFVHIKDQNALLLALHPACLSLGWAALNARCCCCRPSARWITAVTLQPKSHLQIARQKKKKSTIFTCAECLLASWKCLIYSSGFCAGCGRVLKLTRSLIFSVPNNSFKILNEFMLRRKPLEVGALAKQSSEPNLMIIWLTSPSLVYFSNELLSCTG